MARFPRSVFIFDLVVCGLFALPLLSHMTLSTLASVNALLELPGSLPPVSGGAHFFVNFGGVMGVLFNILLLKSRDRQLHWVNIWGRGAVILLIAYYVMTQGLPALFTLFVVSEVVGGILTLPWLRSAEAA